MHLKTDGRTSWKTNASDDDVSSLQLRHDGLRLLQAIEKPKPPQNMFFLVITFSSEIMSDFQMKYNVTYTARVKGNDFLKFTVRENMLS